MPALGATSWTMAILPTPGAQVTAAGLQTNVAAGGRGIIQNKQRCVRVRMTLDNAGANDAYATSGGIPLPSFMPAATDGSYDWGMIRNLDYVVMYGEGAPWQATGNATGEPRWVYNPTAHAIFGYISIPTGAGVTPLATHIQGDRELPTTWVWDVGTIHREFFFTAYGW